EPVLLSDQFGKYRIVRRLGAGGMGTVYLAHDTILGRDIALKVCHLTDDPLARERFRQEARASAVLRHPNLCPVHEYDERDGLALLTLAYIQGPSLEEVLKTQPLDQRQAAILVRKVALAMQAAHEGGVIHRDLKPANIILERNEPVIVDFGLARRRDATTR